MKKILSLALAAAMVVSTVPAAYAAEIPEIGTTSVTLVGSEEAAASYYEVAVPASMVPGGNADVTAEGTWRSTETLKVTAPEKVTLYYGDQSIDVAIQFDGINQVGNDQVGSSATANLKLADASVKFGTWTGVIEYNAELVSNNVGGSETPSPDPDTGNDGEEATIINFTIDGVSYQAEDGMSWGEWVESDYNNGVFYVTDDETISKVGDGTKVVKLLNIKVYAANPVTEKSHSYA